MRWRLADRIDAFEPWASIQGRKAVSLEEYSLLERFGREGVLPASLVLESCVQFARWLVIVSSDFQLSCLVKEISEFTYESEARMGDNLRIEITVTNRSNHGMELTGEVRGDDRRIAKGTLQLELMNLDDIQDPETFKILWRDLYGQA